MAEVGIDISVQKSESIEEYAAKEFEFVVTLCAEEECPWLPAGVTHLEWPLPDPAVSRVGTTEEERLQKFRDARDEIARRLHSQWPSG
jgi:arsenate reductase